MYLCMIKEKVIQILFVKTLLKRSNVVNGLVYYKMHYPDPLK